MLTVFTIFIIALGYNLVVELFPGGGGGYKVASKLLHPYAGLIAGSALIVDYVLTITISVASGADAIFSFLPHKWAFYKMALEAMVILLLLALNLRGMKETIKFLLPLFLGFLLVHVILICYGIFAHSEGLFALAPMTWHETRAVAQSSGWLAVLGITLHAYSLGSGTFTGLEAVSNNVQRLTEPRVETAKRTMLYMAISLSFTAGGIMLLYLLWDAKPVPGMTLNAVVFQSILGPSPLGHTLLIITLYLEAALLLVAANTGFIAGPNVLANMAMDNWLPSRFRHLSSRLVVQNGLLWLGAAALMILFITMGNVSVLVVLYSINVFITFSLALLGVGMYWVRRRERGWLRRTLLAGFACCLTTSILCVTIYYKLLEGGWITLLITFSMVLVFYLIHRHYQNIATKLKQLNQLMRQPLIDESVTPMVINPQQQTAIIFVQQFSIGMHTLLSVLRLLPGQFKNFVFLSAGTVDAESFSGQIELDEMQAKVQKDLDYLVRFCCQHGYPAESYVAFGTDTIAELKQLAQAAGNKYPHAIFFASQLVFEHDNVITRFLHHQTAFIIQHQLHLLGRELMILPMRI